MLPATVACKRAISPDPCMTIFLMLAFVSQNKKLRGQNFEIFCEDARTACLTGSHLSEEALMERKTLLYRIACYTQSEYSWMEVFISMYVCVSWIASACQYLLFYLVFRWYMYMYLHLLFEHSMYNPSLTYPLILDSKVLREEFCPTWFVST